VTAGSGDGRTGGVPVTICVIVSRTSPVGRERIVTTLEVYDTTTGNTKFLVSFLTAVSP
jgi:hypothetical protein